MKTKRRWLSMIGFLFALVAVISTDGLTEEEYKVTFEQFEKAKAFYDDPQPVIEKLSWKKLLPPKVYAELTYDVESMKKGWAELVDFRTPDVVGKIAPEIKLGKYTYEDKDKFPGLQELMWPTMYNRFKPGGPPHCGNFPEIEVVPTKQYYMSIPVIEATRANLGKAELDEKGYLIEETYEGGVPFPRPEGNFKPQQIVYNWVKNYLNPENACTLIRAKGYTAGLMEDFNSKATVWQVRLHSRVTIPPYGWFDEQARKSGETMAFTYYPLSPRDLYGNLITNTMFRGWDNFDQFLIYIAQLRRIRKISGTDTQDIAVGQDNIYEDSNMWSQKITPFRNPYSYGLIMEREYLVPAYTEKGSEYLSQKNLEWHNLKFERRPCYVLELTQLDRSYVYGTRILYIDKETFALLEMVNYDQKGRLYRTQFSMYAWHPEFGNYAIFQNLQADHLDLHSTWAILLCHPATWITRKHVSMNHLIKKGK